MGSRGWASDRCGLCLTNSAVTADLGFIIGGPYNLTTSERYRQIYVLRDTSLPLLVLSDSTRSKNVSVGSSDPERMIINAQEATASSNGKKVCDLWVMSQMGDDRVH